ncbi:hypothetical protein JL720_6445 [Aureococcus anophagefferens]|nr:hypothetical protein JL720_6445 [Aureococcus anophagefferens]
MASYVQPDSWRGVPLEDYASEQAKKGARPKSSVLTPERVSTGLSPVPEDASSRQLDVGPVGVSRPADDDDDDDAASMRSGASRASSATYSVASLGSVISSDDMVTVRVRERRTGHMREYHVVAKYAQDSGKTTTRMKARYRASQTSRLGHRYREDLGSLGRGGHRQSTRAPARRPSREPLHARRPPAERGLLDTLVGYGTTVLSALGSRGDRPT